MVKCIWGTHNMTVPQMSDKYLGYGAPSFTTFTPIKGTTLKTALRDSFCGAGNWDIRK